MTSSSPAREPRVPHSSPPSPRSTRPPASPWAPRRSPRSRARPLRLRHADPGHHQRLVHRAQRAHLQHLVQRLHRRGRHDIDQRELQRRRLLQRRPQLQPRQRRRRIGRRFVHDGLWNWSSRADGHRGQPDQRAPGRDQHRHGHRTGFTGATAVDFGFQPGTTINVTNSAPSPSSPRRGPARSSR